MRRLEAAEELRTRRASAPLSPDDLYDLVLLATGDRDRAEEAMRAVIAAKLREET